MEYFAQEKGITKLYDIFILNDKNGKWYPATVRKSIYKIMTYYTLQKNKFLMPKLPKYTLKDFQ